MKHDPQSLTKKKRKRTQSRRQHLPKSSGPIQLLRMRVATAETLLKSEMIMQTCNPIGSQK